MSAPLPWYRIAPFIPAMEPLVSATWAVPLCLRGRAHAFRQLAQVGCGLPDARGACRGLPGRRARDRTGGGASGRTGARARAVRPGTPTPRQLPPPWPEATALAAAAVALAVAAARVVAIATTAAVGWPQPPPWLEPPTEGRPPTRGAHRMDASSAHSVVGSSTAAPLGRRRPAVGDRNRSAPGSRPLGIGWERLEGRSPMPATPRGHGPSGCASGGPSGWVIRVPSTGSPPIRTPTCAHARVGWQPGAVGLNRVSWHVRRHDAEPARRSTRSDASEPAPVHAWDTSGPAPVTRREP
jgi:hypothetical protein